VLDVGCGTGKSLLPLVRRGYHRAGCDLSADMLSRALSSMARLLGAGGLLTFDLNSLSAHREGFAAT